MKVQKDCCTSKEFVGWVKTGWTMANRITGRKRVRRKRRSTVAMSPDLQKYTTSNAQFSTANANHKLPSINRFLPIFAANFTE